MRLECENGSQRVCFPEKDGPTKNMFSSKIDSAKDKVLCPLSSHPNVCVEIPNKVCAGNICQRWATAIKCRAKQWC